MNNPSDISGDSKLQTTSPAPSTVNASSTVNAPITVNAPSTDNGDTLGKPIASMHKRLLMTWLLWLLYRLLALPVLISIFNPSSPDVLGGIAWYGLWLIPAFILTPVVIRGRSPYMLLVGSLFTLVYLGASGVVLFTRLYGSSWAEIAVYGLDFILILFINVWLFLLLKRLPSMNNVVKQPRSR